MSSPKSDKIILAFDLYGTLLSTSSIAAKLATHFGQERADSIALLWRRYQLEYSWRLTAMGVYDDFSALTRRSLLHALREHGLSLEEGQVDELMRAYDRLDAFEDVGPALQALRGDSSIAAVVFSNGTQDMVGNSVRGSAVLSAPGGGAFSDIIVIGEARKYKPAAEVYRMLARKMGKGTDEASMGQMWMVSSNPFDVVGARSVGMQAAWVDRAGKGWIDGAVAGDKGRPTVIARSIGDVVRAAKEHAAQVQSRSKL